MQGTPLQQSLALSQGWPYAGQHSQLPMSSMHVPAPPNERVHSAPDATSDHEVWVVPGAHCRQSFVGSRSPAS